MPEPDDRDYEASRRRPRPRHYDDDMGGAAGIIATTPARTLGGWVAGAVGAFIGMFGGDTYTKSKLLEFDTEVSNLVRNDILNRKGGAGAGIDSGAAGMLEHPMPMGGFGPGAGSHAIREAHELNLIKSGKYPFAKFIKVVGSMPITLGAAAIGGLTAMAAYFTLVPKKKESVKISPEEAYALMKRAPENLSLSESPKSGMKEKVEKDFMEFVQAYQDAKDNPEKRQEFLAKLESNAAEGREKMREAAGKDWKDSAPADKTAERALGE